MTYDVRGTPVSHVGSEAMDVYERALLQFQSYFGDPVATLDEAIAQSPDFTLAHLFRSIVLLTFSEQGLVGEARKSLQAAETLLGQANERERGLFNAARKMADGDWDGACVAFDRVLVDYPRDALAIQAAHLMDFYRGDALNLRNRISRVMPAWGPTVPSYSYILGMHAFGLEECNQYADAEATARRALEIEARDPWAVHAATHVMEMQGRCEEGIAWLESREQDWAPDNGFAFHNWWHLALYYLDTQQTGRVFELYDRHIYPGSAAAILQLIDATALLWRLYLEDVDVSSRAAVLADDWARRIAVERGYYAFNDFHAVLALTMAGRESMAREVVREMEQTAILAGMERSNIAMTREVGLPLVRGILAFGRQRYGEAVEQIGAVRDIAHRFGGSHAQRDVVGLTLIQAALRGGQLSLARHLIGERTVHKPAGNTGWRLLGRTALRSSQAGERLAA